MTDRFDPAGTDLRRSRPASLRRSGAELVLRSAVFNVLFYLTLLAMMVFGSPALVVGRRGVMWLSRQWGNASLFLLRLVCGMEVEFRGRERVPAGACIVASKHQSFLEIFALATIFPDFTFVLKRELARIPLFGWYASRGGQIAIDRASGRAALAQVTAKAREALADHRQVLIFPEGTRRPPGAEPQYKLGVAFIYAETGAICLPVALNSGVFWPRRSFLRRPGRVVIEFLPPIEPGLEKTAFLQVLQQAIEPASTRLAEDATAADPSLREIAGATRG